MYVVGFSFGNLVCRGLARAVGRFYFFVSVTGFNGHGVWLLEGDRACEPESVDAGAAVLTEVLRDALTQLAGALGPDGFDVQPVGADPAEAGTIALQNVVVGGDVLGVELPLLDVGHVVEGGELGLVRQVLTQFGGGEVALAGSPLAGGISTHVHGATEVELLGAVHVLAGQLARDAEVKAEAFGQGLVTVGGVTQFGEGAGNADELAAVLPGVFADVTQGADEGGGV